MIDCATFPIGSLSSSFIVSDLFGFFPKIIRSVLFDVRFVIPSLFLSFFQISPFIRFIHCHFQFQHICRLDSLVFKKSAFCEPKIEVFFWKFGASLERKSFIKKKVCELSKWVLMNRVNFQEGSSLEKIYFLHQKSKFERKIDLLSMFFYLSDLDH